MFLVKNSTQVGSEQRKYVLHRQTMQFPGKLVFGLQAELSGPDRPSQETYRKEAREVGQKDSRQSSPCLQWHVHSEDKIYEIITPLLAVSI